MNIIGSTYVHSKGGRHQVAVIANKAILEALVFGELCWCGIFELMSLLDLYRDLLFYFTYVFVCFRSIKAGVRTGVALKWHRQSVGMCREAASARIKFPAEVLATPRGCAERRRSRP